MSGWIALLLFPMLLGLGTQPLKETFNGQETLFRAFARQGIQGVAVIIENKSVAADPFVLRDVTTWMTWWLRFETGETDGGV